MEHDVGGKQVPLKYDCPRCVLLYARYAIDEDLANDNEDDMDEPGALVVDPLCVQIGHGRLVQGIVVVLLDLVHGQDRGGSPSLGRRRRGCRVAVERDARQRGQVQGWHARAVVAGRGAAAAF